MKKENIIEIQVIHQDTGFIYYHLFGTAMVHLDAENVEFAVHRGKLLNSDIVIKFPSGGEFRINPQRHETADLVPYVKNVIKGIGS